MTIRDNLSLSPAAASPPPARFAAWLIHRAARHAPPDLSARLEEEWLADLAARSSTLSRLRFALGCSWATRVIARDPIAFGVTAHSAAAGHGTISAFLPEDASPFSRRSIAVFLVIALHVAVIYAFPNGIVDHVIRVWDKPFNGSIIDRPQSPLPPPPGPRVEFTPWRAVDPKVPLNFNLPPLTGAISESVALPPTAASHNNTMIRVMGGPGAGFPSTDIFYPPASQRLGEAGAVAVRVCVDGHGRLINDPTIANSSGFARLDAGALALAKAGSGAYRSTMENGQPVTSCYAFRVRFQLKE
jgi:protein TonB